MLSPDKQPDHRWRRVGLMAAAGIAVLAAGTVLVLTTADDDADPQPAATVPPASSAPATVNPPATVAPPTTVAPPAAPDPQEAIALAQGFMEARDAWNGEAVRALVTDDAVIDDFGVTTPTTTLQAPRSTGPPDGATCNRSAERSFPALRSRCPARTRCRTPGQKPSVWDRSPGATSGS